MSRALHVRPLAHPVAPKKAGKQRPKPTLALVPRSDMPCAPALMERSVEVFDRDGHLIEAYSVMLEDNCHEAEFEEVALIFTEQSGRVTMEEIVHLRARCV